MRASDLYQQLIVTNGSVKRLLLKQRRSPNHRQKVYIVNFTTGLVIWITFSCTAVSSKVLNLWINRFSLKTLFFNILTMLVWEKTKLSHLILSLKTAWNEYIQTQIHSFLSPAAFGTGIHLIHLFRSPTKNTLEWQGLKTRLTNTDNSTVITPLVALCWARSCSTGRTVVLFTLNSAHLNIICISVTAFGMIPSTLPLNESKGANSSSHKSDLS